MVLLGSSFILTDALHLHSFFFFFRWCQPVQQQQWRLLTAVSAHVSNNQGLHVHRWI